MHTGSRAVLILATALLAATPAAADEAPAWAASRVSLLNTVNTYELDKSNSLTWNPYYAVGVRVSPAWRLTEDLSIGAGIAVLREITESDATTREGEWWFDDLTVSAGHRGIELPVIGTRLGGSLALFFPTSKASQARSMQIGVRPGISLTQSFPVLAGLSLRYDGSVRFNAHEYTTSTQVAPSVAACRGLECDELSHSGVRNVRWQHGHRLGVALGVFDWLSLSAGAGVFVSHLYEGIAVETDAPFAVAPDDRRYLMAYDAELTLGPWQGLSAGLGLSTYNPQRAPDQTRYDAFYNRYTQAYLDLRIDIAGLIARREEK
ncbi:MAG: hypothetical protein H6703_11460 [Myxococcales bacterium]|nr:hypothetical protein [Myxococcales bacterium]